MQIGTYKNTMPLKRHVCDIEQFTTRYQSRVRETFGKKDKLVSKFSQYSHVFHILLGRHSGAEIRTLKTVCYS